MKEPVVRPSIFFVCDGITINQIKKNVYKSQENSHDDRNDIVYIEKPASYFCLTDKFQRPL